ncbi:hypothetical protein LGZ99_03180 [Photorhabdus temperata]|nr:hypothetical protein [Photorhabdus temperata]ERT10895.1 hypothetical protein O185_22335 [Photorhabdus temperata J3]MCT8346236.1 hypothetical protein [Photorhabdus temperata]
MQNKTSFLSGTPEQHLVNAGYQNVFDIASINRAAFIQSVPTLPAKQEPVIKGLTKLNVQSGVPVLKDALVDNIGGDGDFSDLMKRTSQYTDAASIQSLSSPGRYATTEMFNVYHRSL